MYLTYALLFALGIALTLLAVKRNLHWLHLLAAGLLFRGIFLFVTPHLSDDYFRFTWDGELQKDGFSSFAFQPKHYATFFGEDSLLQQKYASLYQAHSEAFPAGMNSKGYYSIYPTVNQTLFHIAARLGTPNEGNLVVLRLFLLLAEVATFFLLLVLLPTRHLATGLFGLYWLNPLVIIEIVGNLHLDGLAVTFVLLTLWLLQRSAYTPAGLALALAVCTKLNPLFLTGALFRKVPLKTFLRFSSVTVIASVLLLALTLDADTVGNFKESFGLYFAWFEFNAGPYYLLREIGWWITHQDISPVISLSFPFITLFLFAVVLWRTNTALAERFLLLYLIYFSFSPVVHPWYLVVMIPLAVISRKLYPLLWSLLVFFTYTTYRTPFGESLPFIQLEYGMVYALFYLETKAASPLLNRFKDGFFGVEH